MGRGWVEDEVGGGGGGGGGFWTLMKEAQLEDEVLTAVQAIGRAEASGWGGVEGGGGCLEEQNAFGKLAAGGSAGRFARSYWFWREISQGRLVAL